MINDWKISVRWGFNTFFVVWAASQYRTTRGCDQKYAIGAIVVDFSCYQFCSMACGDLFRLRGGSTKASQGADIELSFTIPLDVKVLNESTLAHYWLDKSKAATIIG
jgi:hypothetical protein